MRSGRISSSIITPFVFELPAASRIASASASACRDGGSGLALAGAVAGDDDDSTGNSNTFHIKAADEDSHDHKVSRSGKTFIPVDPAMDDDSKANLLHFHQTICSKEKHKALGRERSRIQNKGVTPSHAVTPRGARARFVSRH